MTTSPCRSVRWCICSDNEPMFVEKDRMHVNNMIQKFDSPISNIVSVDVQEPSVCIMYADNELYCFLVSNTLAAYSHVSCKQCLSCL